MAPPPPYASCVDLPRTCGATGNDSCCTSPEVDGGTYYRSYDVAGDENSGQRDSVARISSFRLDKYAVTVGRFRTFVRAGLGTQVHPPAQRDGAHAMIPESGWDSTWNDQLSTNTAELLRALKCRAEFQSWTDIDQGHENKPITCVSWPEAMAFCAWDGGYLPTEAEWNYAAAGGDQQRAYPWSDPDHGSLVLNPMLASYGDGTHCVGDGNPADCTADDLLPVGSRPLGDGRWRQSDLAGNVWEWMLDWSGAYPDQCTDCANLTPAAERAQRGGSFINGQFSMRTGYRYSTPSLRYYNVGFRCARPG